MKSNNLIRFASIEEHKESKIGKDENLEPRPECCIYRVPKELRRVNEEAYTPKVISIGPLHYDNQEFAYLEKQKIRCKREFSRRITPKIWEELATFIQENEQRIRNCYEEITSSHLQNQLEFVTMILYDSVFILELLLRFSECNSVRLKPRLEGYIALDLLMLENQLPYFVLQELFKIAFPKTSASLLFISCEFFDAHMPIDSSLNVLVPDDECHYPEETYICDYINLMDSLINSEEDVNLLADAGIISSHVGDNVKVAKMFNNICLHISLGDKCYRDVLKELKAHYENPWSHVVATLKRVYFNNLWRGTATFAAVLLLILTFIQTRDHPGTSGLTGNRPVIHPLTRAGGCRCSVKPASRCALYFRSRVSQAFAQPTWTTLFLDWASPHKTQQAQPAKSSQRSNTLMPQLGYRLALLSPVAVTERKAIYKDIYLSLSVRCGN
ncbi:transmembrane protein [Citrus sinensis]|uniref:Transmembrane protein n=1 Tax=Citrus sinensis TaxID=2711 RepID=A0ACB8JPA5_CITSI|nr:transmembrane protein [Citrus sinensis]